MKTHADINGRMWEAVYPLCAGCDELVITGGCTHEGNGCKYPKERIKKPVTIHRAFLKLCKRLNLSVGEACKELGSCIDE